MIRSTRLLVSLLLVTVLAVGATVTSPPPADAAVTLTRAGLQARLLTALAVSEKAAATVGSSSLFTLKDSTTTATYTGRTYGTRWVQKIGPNTTIGDGTRGYTSLGRQALVAAYGEDTVAVSLAFLKKPAAGWLSYPGKKAGTLHQYGTTSSFTRMARTAKKWSVTAKRTSTTYTITLPDQVATFVVDTRGRIVRQTSRLNVGTYTAVFTYARPRGISLPPAAATLDGDTFYGVLSARDKQRTAARNIAQAADSLAQAHGHPATTVDDITEAYTTSILDAAATYAANPSGVTVGSKLRPALPTLCVTPSDTTAVVVACS